VNGNSFIRTELTVHFKEVLALCGGNNRFIFAVIAPCLAVALIVVGGGENINSLTLIFQPTKLFDSFLVRRDFALVAQFLRSF